MLPFTSPIFATSFADDRLIVNGAPLCAINMPPAIRLPLSDIVEPQDELDYLVRIEPDSSRRKSLGLVERLLPDGVTLCSLPSETADVSYYCVDLIRT